MSEAWTFSRLASDSRQWSRTNSWPDCQRSNSATWRARCSRFICAASRDSSSCWRWRSRICRCVSSVWLWRLTRIWSKETGSLKLGVDGAGPGPVGDTSMRYVHNGDAGFSRDDTSTSFAGDAFPPFQAGPAARTGTRGGVRRLYGEVYSMVPTADRASRLHVARQIRSRAASGRDPTVFTPPALRPSSRSVLRRHGRVGPSNHALR